MKKRKLAVFVHGWITKGKQWTRRKHRLLSLFENYGYEVKTLNMPGKYMSPSKDFVDYAWFIADEIKKIDEVSSCPCCQRHWPIDEIVLVAHSMGGIACRLYLQDDKIGITALKRKVKKLITLASPHHGTSAAVEDAVEAVINFLTAGFLGETEGFHRSKCYKQLLPGSNFIRDLNALPFPSTTEFHSIWSRGDFVVTPTHTAVSDFANNYFIDDLGVKHNDVMHSVHTCDLVRDILDGKAKIKGLQRYPSECDCGARERQWVPIFFYSEAWKKVFKPVFSPTWHGFAHVEWDGFKSMKKEYLWRCKNSFEGSKCNKVYIQRWKPRLSGCEVGRMRRRFHTWRRSGLRHWVCKKCGKPFTGKKHPKDYDHNGCVGPWSNWHQWHLLWYEWECVNRDNGEICGEKKKSILRPSLLGCSVGKIHKGNRLHDWYKFEKRYLFKFKCSGCGKVVTLDSEFTKI